MLTLLVSALVAAGEPERAAALATEAEQAARDIPDSDPSWRARAHWTRSRTRACGVGSMRYLTQSWS